MIRHCCLADEPTGELDSVTAQDVLDLLRSLNLELGLTTIVVTHDQLVAQVMDRSVAIRDGRTSTEVVHAEEAEETVIIDSVGRLQIPKQLLGIAGLQWARTCPSCRRPPRTLAGSAPGSLNGNHTTGSTDGGQRQPG